ncbi:hypothetical protein ACOJQI_11225 [Bacillus salacetis]|uniref:hypothetical protein n=1 Tax=Bacillus salacetis TaxID=2315464 RepID=UPI003B9FF418
MINYSSIDGKLKKSEFSFKVPSDLPFSVSGVEMNSFNYGKDHKGYSLSFTGDAGEMAELTVGNVENSIYKISDHNFPIEEELIKVSGNEGIYEEDGVIRWSEDEVNYDLQIYPHENITLSKEKLIKIAEGFTSN